MNLCGYNQKQTAYRIFLVLNINLYCTAYINCFEMGEGRLNINPK